MGTSVASPTILKQNSGASKIGTDSGDDLQTVIDAINAAVALRATLASPALTGTPTAPTAATATETTQIATTAFVHAVVAALVDSSPAALDTLNELAAALGDDPNFATTVTNSLALKAALASPAFTGTPTGPTAAAGTSTTQLATTAFVQAAQSLVPLSQSVAASDSTIDITLPTGYDKYVLEIVQANPVSTGGVDAKLYTSTDGGSTFDAGVGNYAATYAKFNASTSNNRNNQPSITIGQTIGGNDNQDFLNATVEIWKPADAKYTNITHRAGYSNSGNAEVMIGHAIRLSEADVDAIRFEFTGLGVESGLFNLYGVKSPA